MSTIMNRLRNAWEHKHLRGTQVLYRVRWDTQTERVGTIGRIGHEIVWIGCACLSFSDIVAMREVE